MINTVIQGNCLEVMKDISDGSIDMILCDLPYGTTQNKWDSIIPIGSALGTVQSYYKTGGGSLF